MSMSLFPYLEKYGWTSPSQNMWAFHDRIREEIKRAQSAIDSKDISLTASSLKRVFAGLEHLMQVEEGRLLPNAMRLLSEDDWREFREGDEEIGWMLEERPAPYPKPEYVHPSEDKKRKELPFDIEDKIRYDEGYLTPEQVNFIFKYIPVDITYVDENDRVVFYNRGDERRYWRFSKRSKTAPGMLRSSGSVSKADLYTSAILQSGTKRETTRV